MLIINVEKFLYQEDYKMEKLGMELEEDPE